MQQIISFFSDHLAFLCAMAALCVSEFMGLSSKVQSNGLLDAAFKALQKKGQPALDKAAQPLKKPE